MEADAADRVCVGEDAAAAAAAAFYDGVEIAIVCEIHDSLL